MFSTTDSKQFEMCFIEWVKTLAQLTDKEVIAIDGKTIRGAKRKEKKSPIHMVSAFACKNNLNIRNLTGYEYSNKIFMWCLKVK